MRRYASLLCLVLSLSLAACGGNGGSGDDDGGDDDTTNGDGGVTPDADLTMPDAPFSDPGCTAGDSECNDCVDNDSDGQIDGFDIECTGQLDDDEGSFATGLPGDNQDVKNQDCFFDGDSGAGNDHCGQHICCMLGYTAQQCMQAGYDNNFDPATDCPALDPRCAEFCAPATPPGCDCFGCCTMCDDQGCVNVSISAPTCDGAEEIHMADQCPVCTKNDECGTDCNLDEGGDPCVVCPGQELPDGCTMQECPGGGTVCTSDDQCAGSEFCLQGCCTIIVNKQ
jgi:hypothetical protein